MKAWRSLCRWLGLLCFSALFAAKAQCPSSFANCWHCVRNMCWSQSGQVSCIGSIDSWYCQLDSYYSCGAGECNRHMIRLRCVCDGYYYDTFGSLCCDIV